MLADSAVPGVQNPFGVGALGALSTVRSAALTLTLACIPASAVALLVRYRRSSGTARMQLKWLVSATAAIVIVYAVVITLSTYPRVTRRSG